MRKLQLTALSLVWIAGVFSVGCAHAQDDPPPPPAPPFGEEPPRPPGKEDPDRKDRIHRLEQEARRLETALNDEGSTDRQRAEWKRRLDDVRRELKELRGAKQPEMARIEEEMRRLKLALEGKDGSPEQRNEWKTRLHHLQAEMDDLRAAAKRREKGPQDPIFNERIHARLKEIDELLARGVGAEDRRQLMAEREKLQAHLGRQPGQQGPGHPGMPPDPELQKLHMEAMELDRESMKLGGKLRSLPADGKDERTETLAKLKDVVTRLFDVREKARTREVEMIKKRLDELTEMLEKRKANRDAIIEKRIKQLSGEADPLDW